MYHSCVIERGNVSEKDYRFLFALSLRRFNENETALIVFFLLFQFNAAFQKQTASFQSFLARLQREYETLLFAHINNVLQWWDAAARSALLEAGVSSRESGSASKHSTTEERQAQFDSDGKNAAETSQQELSKADSSRAAFGKREAPEKITGKFTDDEVRHYFSFLYKDRGDGEGSYLTKDEVDLMFHGPTLENYRTNIRKNYSYYLK